MAPNTFRASKKPVPIDKSCLPVVRSDTGFQAWQHEEVPITRLSCEGTLCQCQLRDRELDRLPHVDERGCNRNCQATGVPCILVWKLNVCVGIGRKMESTFLCERLRAREQLLLGRGRMYRMASLSILRLQQAACLHQFVSVPCTACASCVPWRGRLQILVSRLVHVAGFERRLCSPRCSHSQIPTGAGDQCSVVLRRNPPASVSLRHHCVVHDEVPKEALRQVSH